LARRDWGQALQSFLLPIDIAEIVLHEAGQPDTVIDLLDADGSAAGTDFNL
jgi:hypothetical protein